MKIVLEFDTAGRLVTLLTRHSEHLESFHPDTRLDLLTGYQYQSPIYPGRVRVTVSAMPGGDRLFRHVRRSPAYCEAVGLIG
jgi:hypothetical protein